MFVDLFGESANSCLVLSVAVDRDPMPLHLGKQMRRGRWRDPLRGEMTADVQISRDFLFLDGLMLLPRLLHFLLLRPAAFVECAIARFEFAANPGDVLVGLSDERFFGGV